MLIIDIKDTELFDDKKQEFITIKGCKLQLEHSLVSLSKWESNWNKPFLTKESKTLPETLDYIKCMTITQNVNPMVYNGLTNSDIDTINKYIEKSMTATVFYEPPGSSNMSKRTITSELLYCWMFALNIPMECQKWHLNRLLTLIRVCNIENQPPKKMSKNEIMNRNSALNAARRNKLHTKG